MLYAEKEINVMYGRALTVVSKTKKLLRGTCFTQFGRVYVHFVIQWFIVAFMTNLDCNLW